MTTLGLDRLSGRCEHGFDVATQHPELCPCAALAARDRAQAATLAARPDDRAKVEAAIRRLAATGESFSANDARALHGVRGGIVGATFTALASAGVIEAVGAETSTDRGTHGKPVALWVGKSRRPVPVPAPRRSAWDEREEPTWLDKM